MYDLCDMKVEGNGEQIGFEYPNRKFVISRPAVRKDETGFWIIKGEGEVKIEFKDIVYLRNGTLKSVSY